jgi:CubicO group peptidase (beta-lactamase class C family)
MSMLSRGRWSLTWSVALGLSLTSGAASQDTRDARVANLLDSSASARARSGLFSGVAILAKIGGDAPVGGSVMVERIAGFADRVHSVPISPTTQFVTASVAQSFTAVAIEQLVDRGVVALDAPVSQYLADSVYPRASTDRITVRQLVLHEGGLGSIVANPVFRANAAHFATFGDVLALMRRDTSATEPGPFRYADADNVLLAMIVEETTGLSFVRYMREHVFGPAGMTGSGFDIWPRPPRLAHGYTTRNTDATRASSSLHANDAILPHVGLPGSVAYSTAPDLVRFADALARHTLLSAERLAELWAPAVQTGQTDANRSYGFGFFVGRVGQARILNHGGTGPGIDNAFDIYPDLGLAVIILANLDPPAAQDIRRLTRDAIAALRPER